MTESATLFITLFTTLLAIINPLEAIPVFLTLMNGKDEQEHRRVALKSCLYAMGLMFFFLLFGTVLLRLFGVSLSMVKVVGGVILAGVGFQLFAPKPGGIIPTGTGGAADQNVAFVPMAMPIMFGPGAIATLISIAVTAKHSVDHLELFAACSLAIVATMAITWLSLVYSVNILKRIGTKGIDAATRITGFFVSAMGMGLAFHGVVEFLQSYGLLVGRAGGG